jgi:hypothetical protein
VSIKNRTDLNAQVDVLFPDNSTQFITAAKVREHLKDLDDSAVNILGDSLVQGKLGYSTILTISSDGDIPHKKYVDDLVIAGDLLLYPLDGTRTITGQILATGGANVTKVTGNDKTEILTTATSASVNYKNTSSNYAAELVTNDRGVGVRADFANNFYAYFDTSNLTSDVTFLFKGTGGTLALTSDISALSTVYQPLNTKLTTFAALANASGVLTNDGSGNYSWVAGGGTVTSVAGTSNRITSTGESTPVIDISASYVGQSSITTLGTITTGVWNGTAIANANLANSSVTINGTSVSLGASGTVTAAAGTLTGTTLNSTVVTSSLTTVGTIGAGTWNAGAVTSSGNVTGLALITTGTAGAGYVEVLAQSSAPSAPSGAGLRLFAGSTGNLSWMRNDGGTDTFRRTFSSTLTANRTYTFQDSTYTIAGLETTQAFTVQQTFAAGSFTTPAITFTGSGTTGFYSTGTNNISVATGGALKVTFGSSTVSFADAVNLVTGTTTGTKLGTTTSQKLSFWNKTPIVQPTTSITGATLVSNAGTAITSTDTFGGYTLQQLAAIIINTGLAA